MRLPDVFSNKRAQLPWGIGMRAMRIPAAVAYGLPLPDGEYVGDDLDRDEWEALAIPLPGGSPEQASKILATNSLLIEKTQ